MTVQRKCGRCGQPAGHMFQQPGPRSSRTDDWQLWACAEHRADAEKAWAKRFGVTL